MPRRTTRNDKQKEAADASVSSPNSTGGSAASPSLSPLLSPSIGFKEEIKK
jgi:hypothetical protein